MISRSSGHRFLDRGKCQGVGNNENQGRDAGNAVSALQLKIEGREVQIVRNNVEIASELDCSATNTVKQ